MGDKKLKQRTKREWTRQEGRQLFGEGPVADPVRKAAALQAIRLEAGRKKVIYRPSLPEIFRNELSLISVNYWYLQAVLLCVGIWLSGRAGSLYGPESLLTEAGISPEMFLLPVLSALLALTGITGFGELAKCFSCRMAELEQSCYLNLRQLMMVRMAITGAVNLLFLGCFIGISQGRRQAGLIRISLSLLPPYLIRSLPPPFLPPRSLPPFPQQGPVTHRLKNPWNHSRPEVFLPWLHIIQKPVISFSCCILLAMST